VEENLLDIIPQKKLYNDMAVRVGTFIGGPLVAGYIAAENFKVLEQPEKVKSSWLYAIIATVIIFGIVFFVPGAEKIPNFLIPVIYTLLASYLVKKSQGKEIYIHMQNGGEMYSAWRSVWIGLIGLVVMVGIVFILVLLTDKKLLQQ
jgi:peptidoglycan/LPS O-acetylase OafA/YrhL